LKELDIQKDIVQVLQTCRLTYFGHVTCMGSDHCPHVLLWSARVHTCWAFLVAAPRIWNALPAETTSAQSLTSFRRHLKSWLCRPSYPDLIIWSLI